ncbi:MAG TPA: hydroxymethylbilane synthase [Vicinamibacterales bacterium]|nr:hydroxymethylbilane synthase [Vicinamibacterales bacterium]
MKPLRLGTRGSALALWQARTVASRLERIGRSVELVTISTRGDRRQTESLADLSAEVGKGVFTKEIQDALLRGQIDLAVHSSKDMAAVSPDGLAIGAVLEREDPRDALVLPGTPPPTTFAPALLGRDPVLGTGSPRRIAQLRRLFEGARFEAIRGNVDTRLRKLDEGQVHALVLACAGLRRLGLDDRITAPIPVDLCVPAPGQGIIAIETRSGDTMVSEAVARLNDPDAWIALAAEQAVVAELGGGCQLPLGAHAVLAGQELRLTAVAAAPGGGEAIFAAITASVADPAGAGRRLAADLASRGARELLHS